MSDTKTEPETVQQEPDGDNIDPKIAAEIEAELAAMEENSSKAAAKTEDPPPKTVEPAVEEKPSIWNFM